MFQVIDTHTGRQVGQLMKTRTHAQRKADRMDNEYGAVRYRVQEVGRGLSKSEQRAAESTRRLSPEEEEHLHDLEEDDPAPGVGVTVRDPIELLVCEIRQLRCTTNVHEFNSEIGQVVRKHIQMMHMDEARAS